MLCSSEPSEKRHAFSQSHSLLVDSLFHPYLITSGSQTNRCLNGFFCGFPCGAVARVIGHVRVRIVYKIVGSEIHCDFGREAVVGSVIQNKSDGAGFACRIGIYVQKMNSTNECLNGTDLSICCIKIYFQGVSVQSVIFAINFSDKEIFVINLVCIISINSCCIIFVAIRIVTNNQFVSRICVLNAHQQISAFKIRIVRIRHKDAGFCISRHGSGPNFEDHLVAVKIFDFCSSIDSDHDFRTRNTEQRVLLFGVDRCEAFYDKVVNTGFQSFHCGSSHQFVRSSICIFIRAAGSSAVSDLIVTSVSIIRNRLPSERKPTP